MKKRKWKYLAKQNARDLYQARHEHEQTQVAHLITVDRLETANRELVELSKEHDRLVAERVGLVRQQEKLAAALQTAIAIARKQMHAQREPGHAGSVEWKAKMKPDDDALAELEKAATPPS